MSDLSQVRIREVLAEEAQEPLRWWWCSFADPILPKGEQFLGVAILEARGVTSAAIEAHRLKVNPGGAMEAVAIPDEHLPGPELRERLLSRDELEQAGLV